MQVLILLSLIMHGSTSFLMKEFLQTLAKYHPREEDSYYYNEEDSGLSGPAKLNENLERFREFRKSKEIVNEVNSDDTIPVTAEINELSVMTGEERKHRTDHWEDLMCRDKKGNCRIVSYGWVAKFTCTYGSCQKLTDYQDKDERTNEW